MIVFTWPRRLRRTHRDYTFDNMNYLSTRDARPVPATYSFEDVLLAGLAEDGGLFVPESLPKLDLAALRGLAGLPYPELAARSMEVGHQIQLEDAEPARGLVSNVWASTPATRCWPATCCRMSCAIAISRSARHCSSA